MRISVLALLGMLTCVALATSQQQQQQQAQPATTQPPAVDTTKMLDAHLLRWEDEMKKVQCLFMEGISRTDVNNTLKYKDVLVGTAKYRKPNLAWLGLVRTDKKDVYEKWVCTGTAIYQFAPQQKEILVYPLPAKKDGQQVGEDNFLSFMFGMKAEDAKKRYTLHISKGKENDPYYVYIDIQPQDPRDKVDFQEARLVLNKDTYLPRQLWFRHPNGDETTWDIPRVVTGRDAEEKVDRRDFQQPQLPAKDWKMTQVQKQGDGPPRVVRPKQQ
jgi:TIGR03009 family protein